MLFLLTKLKTNLFFKVKHFNYIFINLSKFSLLSLSFYKGQNIIYQRMNVGIAIETKIGASMPKTHAKCKSMYLLKY